MVSRNLRRPKDSAPCYSGLYNPLPLSMEGDLWLWWDVAVMIKLHYVAKVKGFYWWLHPGLKRFHACAWTPRPHVKLWFSSYRNKYPLTISLVKGYKHLLHSQSSRVRPEKETHTGPEAYLCLLRQEIPGSWFPRMWFRKGGGAVQPLGRPATWTWDCLTPWRGRRFQVAGAEPSKAGHLKRLCA